MTSKSEMNECSHRMLHILDGDIKTTCRRCGRDFYLYADVDPAHEIANLKSIIAKEISENDEFGSEFVISSILRARIEELKSERDQWRAKAEGWFCQGCKKFLRDTLENLK